MEVLAPFECRVRGEQGPGLVVTFVVLRGSSVFMIRAYGATGRSVFVIDKLDIASLEARKKGDKSVERSFASPKEAALGHVADSREDGGPPTPESSKSSEA
mmetsp:Transcript_21086/g.86081  ORF Transcript_21086/g.86081 Transcript_21086/m.86081 type:complete len:101 (+) Transcript_21086:2378-2680(+)